MIEVMQGTARCVLRRSVLRTASRACRLAVQATAGLQQGVTLEQMTIENSFVEELPGDMEISNRTRQVYAALWSRVEPTPVSTSPELIAYSREVCELIGLDPSECERPEFALIFSGCAAFLPGRPYAQVCDLWSECWQRPHSVHGFV
jgi:hypothetical protein